jgi:hypothetical protein
VRYSERVVVARAEYAPRQIVREAGASQHREIALSLAGSLFGRAVRPEAALLREALRRFELSVRTFGSIGP